MLNVRGVSQIAAELGMGQPCGGGRRCELCQEPAQVVRGNERSRDKGLSPAVPSREACMTKA